MPTDLDAVSRRKREAQADGQIEITILLVCVITSLGSLVLVVRRLRQQQRQHICAKNEGAEAPARTLGAGPGFLPYN